VSPVLLVAYAILAALVGGFVAFYLYSRTPAWRSSETRMATMRLMVIIGPMFGMHFKKPPPDRPAVMTPGPDPEEKDPRDLRVS
jgi:Na+-transporting NADH:ubiquinone oxidoreductase subunit NqrB